MKNEVEIREEISRLKTEWRRIQIIKLSYDERNSKNPINRPEMTTQDRFIETINMTFMENEVTKLYWVLGETEDKNWKTIEIELLPEWRQKQWTVKN